MCVREEGYSYQASVCGTHQTMMTVQQLQYQGKAPD